MKQKEYYRLVCIKKSENNMTEDIQYIGGMSTDKTAIENYCEFLNSKNKDSNKTYKVISHKTHKRKGSY